MPNTLTILDLRAQITQICNAGLAAGLDPAAVAMTLGSVAADLNLQIAYRALAEYETDAAIAEILEENYGDTSLPVKIYLFQGLPKADKMEWIIQKTVELGVEGIYPVAMSRCIVKLDNSKKKNKTARWQAIAESAAKQSKRSAIPAVHDAISYKEALELAGEMDLFLVPYENKDGMAPTREALEAIRPGMSVGILIGPEGGFSESEIDDAICAGGRAISLGKRILRTETAAITAVGMCMLHTEMHLTEEGV